MLAHDRRVKVPALEAVHLRLLYLNNVETDSYLSDHDTKYYG